ncbi:MAG: TPM domain-containing protein [Bacteroidetes bacterium]|nr:TPM domain-containing protein [Bacteroidota bacterium]
MASPLTITARRALTGLVFLFVSLAALAQIPAPQPHTYVNDYTGSLTSGEIASLNDQINGLEKRYSVQLAVVLVRKLPDNMEIEDFARGIGREWHAGIDRKGLVYVAALEQNKQRLEVAAGLEGVIPDIIAHDITTRLKPYLRNKDYAGAIGEMVTDINEQLQKEDSSSAKYNSSSTAAVTPGAAPSQGAETPAQSKFSWTAKAFTIGFFSILGLIFVFLGIPNLIRVFRGVRQSGGFFTYYRTSGWLSPDSSSGSSDSGSDSSSSSSSDFGNWGGDSSSDSSSSDSGFDGGGSSDNW